MKKTLIALTIIAVAGTASAFAQENVLVAGWDFEFTPTSYASLSPAGVLGANYSDLYTSPYSSNDGAAANARGTLYLNGTNGADAWSFSGPTATATKNTAWGDIDWQVETRDGDGTKLGGTGGLNSAALGLRSTTASLSEIAFVLNTDGLASLDHVSYRSRMQATGVTASIDWSLNIGGNSYALSGPIGITGTNYTLLSFDLSAIDLGGADSVTLIGTVANASTSNVMLLDNLAVYGSLAAIPEPSTYAGILGLFTLGLGMVRRRRAA